MSPGQAPTLESFPRRCHECHHGATGICSARELNASVLRVCGRFFPPDGHRSRRSVTPVVAGAVAMMWDSYREWRRGQRKHARGRLFRAWRKFAEFRAASKQLRKTALQARKQRIYAIIDRAFQCIPDTCAPAAQGASTCPSTRRHNVDTVRPISGDR